MLNCDKRPAVDCLRCWIKVFKRTFLYRFLLGAEINECDYRFYNGKIWSAFKHILITNVKLLVVYFDYFVQRPPVFAHILCLVIAIFFVKRDYLTSSSDIMQMICGYYLFSRCSKWHIPSIIFWSFGCCKSR